MMFAIDFHYAFRHFIAAAADFRRLPLLPDAGAAAGEHTRVIDGAVRRYAPLRCRCGSMTQRHC